MRNFSAELDINAAGKDIKIFIQGGFFTFNIFNNVIHEHTYTELHVVESGSCVFYINGEPLTLTAGEMVVIPSNMFHYHMVYDQNSRHSAFQVNYPVSEVQVYNIPNGILTAFLDEIDEYMETQNCAKLSAYFALLCSYIITDSNITTNKIQDRDLLIHEFFSVNYNKKITLSDLATRLNVSKKQAERIIFKHTGNTFRTELSKRRMEAAIQLMKTEKISMCEVAARCGYNSYSGFWKAYKTCLDKPDGIPDDESDITD